MMVGVNNRHIHLIENCNFSNNWIPDVVVADREFIINESVDFHCASLIL